MEAIPVAVQLYSVRDAAERDLDAALDRLAACGYRAVEPFDLHGRSASEFGRALRERGLSVVGFHLQPAPREELERTLEALARWGTRRIVVPWVDPDRLRDLPDVERLADELNAMHEVVARWEME